MILSPWLSAGEGCIGLIGLELIFLVFFLFASFCYFIIHDANNIVD